MYFLFLLLAQIMVGTNIVGAKYLLDNSMPVLFLLTFRFGLATLTLLFLHAATPEAKNTLSSIKTLTKRDWLFLVAQAMTAGIIFNLLMLLGLNYTDANEAGIITSVLPALIGVLSWLILKERISIKKALSIGLATLGLLVISFDKYQHVNGDHSFLGDFIVFIALLPEASYYILSKLNPNRLPVFLVSAIINGLNAVILLPILFFQTNLTLLHFSGIQWLALVIISISSGLFYVFWYVGSHKVDAIMASLSTAFMPVSTVVIAWLALGETINTLEFLGMGLVIGSIVAYTFSN